jgi:hypothetical protein
MPDSIGSLTRYAALAACLTIVATSRAGAQQALAQPPATPAFMSRYDFHLSIAALAVDDERFTWDTYWGGDFDVVDYVSGRLSCVADYQAVLGSEFRPFDPNQGTYTLEASSSVRAGATEIAGVIHHRSWHLSDRPKRLSIAMNVLSGRVMRQFALGSATLAMRADAGKVIERAYLDYTWTADLDLLVRRPFNQHAGFFGRAYGEVFGVDPAIAGRDRQQGGRLEAGVGLNGGRGSVELFAGYERVVDAYALDRKPRRWAFAGVRLIGK